MQCYTKKKFPKSINDKARFFLLVDLRGFFFQIKGRGRGGGGGGGGGTKEK